MSQQRLDSIGFISKHRTCFPRAGSAILSATRSTVGTIGTTTKSASHSVRPERTMAGRPVRGFVWCTIRYGTSTRGVLSSARRRAPSDLLGGRGRNNTTDPAETVKKACRPAQNTARRLRAVFHRCSSFGTSRVLVPYYY